MGATDENHQKLTELINDDNTIVTSTYFSSISKLNIKTAQDLLDKYAETEEESNVSCTYIIAGINADNGICILLSKQNELEEKKALFKSIISQHVYSLQKGKNIDLVALANVDPFSSNISREPLKGSVVSSKAVRRKLKKKTIVADKSDIKREIQSVEPKQNKIENQIKTKKNSLESFCTSGNITNGNNFKSKNVIKSKPKNMMTNFLAKTLKVHGSDVKNESNTEKQNVDSITDNKKNDNVDEKTDIEEKDEVCEPMEVDKDESIKENIAGINNVEVSRNENKSTPKQKKNKKRPTKSKSDQPSKKRKRIVETQDSDSDIFASSESEIEIVPDIHLEDFEEEKSEQTLPSKTRRMKQITEEFMDEEGYMNTVKKYVMLSDEEEGKEQKPANIIEKDVVEKPVIKVKNAPAPVSIKNDTSPPKKSGRNGKGKAAKSLQNQPSIMSFFKKN